MPKTILYIVLVIIVIGVVYLILGLYNIVPIRHCYDFLSAEGPVGSVCEWGYKHNYVF